MFDRISGRWSVAMVILASVFLLLVMYRWSPGSSRIEPVDGALRVDVVGVQYQALRIPVLLEGIASAADQVAVLAEVSGSVINRPESLRDGAVVAAGELLLEIDPQSYELALAERRSQVSAARLHLADTRARARVARRVNGDKGSDYARLVPHLEEAEARLAAAQAGLSRAEMDLARTRVMAPFHGRLQDVRASPGQFVRAGEAIATVFSTDRIEVRLPVRDEWLSLLDLPLNGDQPIPPVATRLHGRFAGRDVTWHGHLVRREGGINQNRMLYLVVQVDDADKGDVPLEPGVLVRAEIEGRYHPHIASLPRSVLSGGSNVWLVDEQQRLRRRKVEVVHQNNEHIYIGSGLKDGDQVALSGASRWLDGAQVIPREQAIAALLHTPALLPAAVEHEAP
ncbi:MAG: efflux RND transporter periplasmic adaptor subunit [Alcanivoracaceae bacterium]|jgi:RND family efflux transporter MFP subunit|nr:efflux RND transporter periplasmic adaptor subunit [Alcanivoracaceae bacterium]